MLYGLSVATDASRIASGDLDGDGNVDLAVLDGSNGFVGLWFGRGDGSFGPLFDIELPGVGRRAIAAMDLDLDGIDDVVLLTSRGVSVAMNGPRRAVPSTTFALDFAPNRLGASDLALGDVNDDDHPDIAVARTAPACDVQLFLSRCE